jgi:SAM-dependent methyltransferase
MQNSGGIRQNDDMNDGHLKYLSSPEWAAQLKGEILPWVIGSRALGDDFLEVGPGPGLTTDLLRALVPALTAIEVDADLAAALARRLAAANLDVVHADATAMPFEAGRFSGAACLTMLHHVPTQQLQDQLFGELCRVLRPAGILVGCDSIDTPEVRAGHYDDIFTPIDPVSLMARLEAAGFENVEVEVKDTRVRFAAAKA